MPLLHGHFITSGCCCAGALNFRDVMLAYGKLSRDLMAHGKNGQGGGDYIGLEFSGKVQTSELLTAGSWAQCVVTC